MSLARAARRATASVIALVDEFLAFVAARARPNTLKAYAHDLKVFFTVVDKEPAEVTRAT